MNYSAFKIPDGVDSREVADAKDEFTTKQNYVSLFQDGNDLHIGKDQAVL